MIDEELYGYRFREGAVLQVPAIAQLQPACPVGEGAAVAAYGIGGGAGRHEGCCCGAGLGVETINGQRGDFTVQG